MNESAQPGLETSNASGENIQKHIPYRLINSVQQGIINSADGNKFTLPTPVEAEPVSPIVAKPVSTTTIFGFTPKEAGVGVVGIAAIVALILYGISKNNPAPKG